MSAAPRLVLASASPRRRQILYALGIPFESIDVGVDETPFPDESPELLAMRLAVAKAEAARVREPDAIVIGADTVVEVDGESLGKPRNPTVAGATLRRLRGRTHFVITGVAVAVPPELGSFPAPGGTSQLNQSLQVTEVWMRDYSDDEIEDYIATGDPFDKAGSYAIQHQTFRPVERISGCFLNVVGLPLPVVRRLLLRVIKPTIDLTALELVCPGCADKERLTTDEPLEPDLTFDE